MDLIMKRIALKLDEKEWLWYLIVLPSIATSILSSELEIFWIALAGFIVFTIFVFAITNAKCQIQAEKMIEEIKYKVVFEEMNLWADEEGNEELFSPLEFNKIYLDFIGNSKISKNEEIKFRLDNEIERYQRIKAIT